MHSSSAGVLDQLPQGSRVLIVRLRSMGDCVLTTPAIRMLGEYRPDLRIGVVVETRFADIFRNNPAVCAVLPPSVPQVVRFRPRLCLNLHGGTRSQILTLASRARVKAGFSHHRGARLYRVRIPRAQEILGEERPVHTAEHLASAVFYLGCPRREIPRAQLFAAPPGRPRPYAVVHPTAAAAYKTWPPAGFLAVATRLRERHGLEVVFIGSAGDDMSPFRGYESLVGAPLGEVISLISGAACFVGNDSGPAHIAAAYDVPLVVLFGRREHEVTWAPWRASAARTLVDPEGIGRIAEAKVLEALEEALSRRGNGGYGGG